MPDVDLDAIRETVESVLALNEIDGAPLGEWPQRRQDLLALLAERDCRIAELEGLLHKRGNDVEYVLGERDRLRAAAQAVGADMDDVDFYGDPQKWPPVLNISRAPLAALAAAQADRDE